MPDRVAIAETQLQPLKGNFPDVETYPHVDTALLYQGDEANPFHVILPIAEIGRVSANGLEYDEELVTAIAEQMSSGAGGIRGHIPDDQLSTAYPVDDVHWIGHKMDGKTLWAKGYIPPGQTREDIRMKKARGGNIATSIFGDAVKELSQNSTKKTWKARQFALEQIDLAPTKRAALKNKHGFVITREMQEGEEMPDVREITSAAEVPVAIREQIIKEAEVAAKVEKVSELTTQVAEMETQIAELATYKQIVLEIRTTLGKDTDTAAAVAEQHAMASKLAEMLGVEYSNVTITVQEMHEKIKEIAKKEFEGAVDSKVAELTNWNAQSDASKLKVASFRKTFRRNVLAELGGERAPEKIAEIATKLWDEEFSVLGALVVAELGGPNALITGRENPKPAGSAKDAATREAEARTAFELS